jgi:excisionase family DNA binding protein
VLELCVVIVQGGKVVETVDTRNETIARLETQIRAELGAFTSAASLSRWLNVRAGTIVEWIEEGLLEGYRMKRGIRITAASIARFLADRKID